MAENNSMDIVRELMFSIAETSEWEQIERTDPMICESERRFEEIKQRIMGQLACEEENDLFDGMQSVLRAYVNAAILYGMKVSDAFREAVARPAAFSQYDLDCCIAIERRVQQGKNTAEAS